MSYICGNYFKNLCRYSTDEEAWETSHSIKVNTNSSVDNNFFFIKTDLIPFIAQLAQQNPLTITEPLNIITHNSDLVIDKNTFLLLTKSIPNIKRWYAQNIIYNHPTLHPLPIGIANDCWPHGRPEAFYKASKQKLPKNNLVYANFNAQTNPKERLSCLKNLKGLKSSSPQEVGYEIAQRTGYTGEQLQLEAHYSYLKKLASSYFCISPEGNGPDCHRHWEALYMQCVPIITNSIMASKLKSLGLPFMILETWDDYGNLELDDTLYHKTWRNFNPDTLKWKFFIKHDE
tara:strand:- start:10967 stop:11830 length:864 start_codon:yes stop_codon:yes gene_type:complete